ncbi:hypothetical protein AWP99_24830 [Escherichia coli]|nr:hypothetical protein AWP99_24830 [Escherichia coli]
MRIRYGWELALAALLVIEIVAFGAINPRMLDLNMLLFSTSDFICIGIVALPLTMVIVSGGVDILFWSTIGFLRHCIRRTVSKRRADAAGDSSDLSARRIVRAD